MADINESMESMEEPGNVQASPFVTGQLPDNIREAITRYLTDQLGEMLNNETRQKLLDRVKKWRRQREMINEEETKNFPWEGASNVSHTLTLTNANGAYSIIKRSLSAKKPFFSVDGFDAFHEAAESIERLLDVVSEGTEYMNVRKANREVALDLAITGTVFVRTPWTKREWSYKRRDPRSGDLISETYTQKDCPEMIPIAIEDFFTRPEWQDLQVAPWFAVRHWLTRSELKQRAALGVYQAVDEVLARHEKPLPDMRIEALRNAGIELTTDYGLDEFDIFEVNMFFDVDEDGLDEDIKVWFDLWSGNIMRWELNSYTMRDVTRIPFIERPGQLYAMGVGWILETITDAAKALQDMRIDGTKLAAFQMYVTSTSSNLGPNEEFFPLKNIRVNNVRDDFLPVKFPDIGPGTLSAEYTLKEDAARATGVSEAMMGFSDQTVRTRYTTSGAMFQAQQNSALMETILEGIEHAYAEIGKMVVLQLAAHPDRTREIAKALSPEDRQRIEVLFTVPPHELSKVVKVSIRSTDQAKTEEARKQQVMTLTQLYTMYGQQVFQLLPMIYGQQNQVPPPVQAVAAKFFIGATKLIDRVFNLMDHPETEDYLPYIKDIEMMVDAMDAKKDQAVAGQRQSGGVQGGMGPSGNRPAGTGPTPGAGRGAM